MLMSMHVFCVLGVSKSTFNLENYQSKAHSSSKEPSSIRLDNNLSLECLKVGRSLHILANLLIAVISKTVQPLFL